MPAPDPFDNCPQRPNADQADLDGDAIGDACPARVAHGSVAGDPRGRLRLLPRAEFAVTVWSNHSEPLTSLPFPRRWIRPQGQERVNGPTPRTASYARAW